MFSKLEIPNRNSLFICEIYMCTFRRGKSLFNFGISIYSEGGLLTLNTKNYKTLLLRGMYWCKKNQKISLNKIKLWIYSTREKNSKNNPVYKITIFWQDFQGNFLYICWKLGDLNMITYWLGRTTTLQQTTPKLWTFLKNSQSGLKFDEKRLKIIFSGF